NAIKSEDDLTADEMHFLDLNAELSQQWPVITQMQDNAEAAKEWDGKPNKLELLER
ncbi:MAG: DUF3470 domain-containing protein, partial [Wohlfahrtiimonas sp.]